MDLASTPGKSATDATTSKESSSFGDLASCCVQTIRHLALYNPMMVCGECKQIIKCFQEEKAYQNYVTFCESRRRPIVKGAVDGYYTVVFRSYETTRR